MHFAAATLPRWRETINALLCAPRGVYPNGRDYDPAAREGQRGQGQRPLAHKGAGDGANPKGLTQLAVVVERERERVVDASAAASGAAMSKASPLVHACHARLCAGVTLCAERASACARVAGRV